MSRRETQTFGDDREEPIFAPMRNKTGRGSVAPRIVKEDEENVYAGPQHQYPGTDRESYAQDMGRSQVAVRMAPHEVHRMAPQASYRIPAVAMGTAFVAECNELKHVMTRYMHTLESNESVVNELVEENVRLTKTVHEQDQKIAQLSKELRMKSKVDTDKNYLLEENARLQTRVKEQGGLLAQFRTAFRNLIDLFRSKTDEKKTEQFDAMITRCGFPVESSDEAEVEEFPFEACEEKA